MFDDLFDIANRSTVDPDHYGLAPAEAYFLGITEEENVGRGSDAYNDFLYVSVRRPLGMWFDPDTPYNILGSSHRASVVGTSEPLKRAELNSFELVPFDARTRAATVLKEWDENGRPKLASARPDGNGGMDRIDLFLDVPEHDGDRSRVAFDKRGPIMHMCYTEPDPMWTYGSETLLDGVTDMLCDNKQLIPASFAETQVNRWTENVRK